MANRVKAKARSRSYIDFGALNERGFAQITPVINQVVTTVQDYIALPYAVKISLVTIVASGASGVTGFNIGVGVGAITGIGTPDNSDVTAPPTMAVASNGLFAATKAVVLVANVPQTFVVDDPDVIYGQNTLLTLRYVSGGAVAGTMKVTFAYLAVDVKLTKPDSANFNWLTDIG